MDNEERSKVLDKGTLEVGFTFRKKKITLVNVLYVLDMNINLVSGSFCLANQVSK